ncbi:MAG TPA: dihydroorotate dehydrogenase-like protein [Bacteroidales bacterium]|nr:dihydroorotate dehydrogenase-like protein [Bacteroidales bacterium]
MSDLRTNYMGIELKNPIIVGASNLVLDEHHLKQMEEAGAAAVVYKSLFEEQVQLENLALSEAMDEYSERHAEMTTLFPDIEHAGPREFLMNLRNARKAISIPLFASLNAVYQETWVEYAEQLAETGVDGLELNFYSVPQDFHKTEVSITDEQIAIVKEVKKAVSIPVAVKLSPYYTNPLYLIKKLDEAGVNGIVMFNRLFQPDIDIDLEENYFPYNLSHQQDSRIALRFAGLLYGNVNAGICANTGILTGEDVITMILAGADCVQVVSTLYKNQIEYISTMLTDMQEWMHEKQYQKLDDFRGKLSKKRIKDPFAYKRAQYVDILLKSEEIFKRYPMR